MILQHHAGCQREKHQCSELIHLTADTKESPARPAASTSHTGVISWDIQALWTLQLAAIMCYVTLTLGLDGPHQVTCEHLTSLNRKGFSVDWTSFLWQLFSGMERQEQQLLSIFNPDMTQCTCTGESVPVRQCWGLIKSLLGGFRPQLLIKNTDIPWEEKKRVLTESCWSRRRRRRRWAISSR